MLREINFSYFRVSKYAILTILEALSFEYLGIFDIFKNLKFKASKIDFTWNLSGRKTAKFPHSVTKHPILIFECAF